jgi:hypothetical protein
MKRGIGMRTLTRLLVGLPLAGVQAVAVAEPVTIPHVFNSGSPARASDVNENFTVLAKAVEATAEATATLDAAVQALHSGPGGAFSYRSGWSAATAYAANDVVSRSGSAYIALVSVKGTDPVADVAAGGGKWSLLVQKGTDGASGTPGTAGPAGIQGVAGVAGPAGATGATGATGAAGPAGATGSAGVAGPTGPTGPMGPTGAAGAMGAAGPQGLSGAAGATGATGPQGVAGPQGIAGTAGAAGTPGAAGAAGPQGPAGATGATGVGVLVSKDGELTGAGLAARESNKDGKENTGLGNSTLRSNVSGNANTAVGYRALTHVEGSGNIAIGASAGILSKAGNSNIYVGSPGMDSEDRTIRIGSDGEQVKTFMAGIYGVTPDLRTAAVVVDENGQLGTVSSSRRYKFDISPMADASERLMQLRPVTFRYQQPTSRGEHPLQFGLIAEEVAEVFPDLVVYNKAGQPETVAYHLLAALLLNELQKEHQLNAQQGEQLERQSTELQTLHAQREQMQALEARLVRMENLALPALADTAAQPRGASR